MVNILIVVIIILVFSFIMGLIITGNDNRVSEEERRDMVDDPGILFDQDSKVAETTESVLESQHIDNPVSFGNGANSGVSDHELDNHLPTVDVDDKNEKESLFVQDHYQSIPGSYNKVIDIDIDDEII